MKQINVKKLRRIISYDANSGAFKWLARFRRVQLNRRPGTVTSQGYRRVGIRGRVYEEHRIAFALMTGHWPVKPIDHKNGKKDDNRWVNLRLAIGGINNQNIRAPKKNNSTGFLGVKRNGKKFAACIQIGVFKTARQAHAAYLKAKRELHAGATI